MGIEFDLDVASPPGGIPWIPAARFYTMEDDGLSSPWTGRVWMNPPFSKPAPWAHRFLDHGHGVALLPMSNARWFDAVWSSGASTVALRYGFKFAREDKDSMISYRTMLVAFGDECVEAISQIGHVR